MHKDVELPKPDITAVLADLQRERAAAPAVPIGEDTGLPLYRPAPAHGGAFDLAKALRQAYNYGQTYWQQADSDYVSQHKKSEETAIKFAAFVDESVAALAQDWTTTEAEKVAIDLMAFGTGVSIDGKHIPYAELFASSAAPVPAEQLSTITIGTNDIRADGTQVTWHAAAPERSGKPADALSKHAHDWQSYWSSVTDGIAYRCECGATSDTDTQAEHSSAAPSDAFQSRVQPWLMACFGPMIAGDREERNHRFLEEALELVQACDCTQYEAHQLVDYVYGRPVGDKPQEIGGVMVTLAALCLANDMDMHQCGETELARIWTKVEQIRAKQAAKPKHSPLPVAAPSPTGESPSAPEGWQLVPVELTDDMLIAFAEVWFCKVRCIDDCEMADAYAAMLAAAPAPTGASK